MHLTFPQVYNLMVSNGINFFDTADSYGTGRLNGRSELLLVRQGCVCVCVCVLWEGRRGKGQEGYAPSASQRVWGGGLCFRCKEGRMTGVGVVVLAGSHKCHTVVQRHYNRQVHAL
jgi:hypothetical protein